MPSMFQTFHQPLLRAESRLSAALKACGTTSTLCPDYTITL